jgi:hypothetical protein
MDQINVDVIVSNGTNVQVNSPSTSVNAFVNLPPPLSPTVTSPTYDTQACVVLPQGPQGPQGPAGIVNTGELDSRYVNLTGDQTISGVKTFLDNINVSGSGIFNALDLNNIDILTLSGVDISITNGNVSITNGNVILTNPISAPNLVYKTGDQTISGNKTFQNSKVNISGSSLNFGNFIQLGAPVTVTQSNNTTTQIIDSIDTNVQITRGSHLAIYNPDQEGSWNGSTPTYTEWNADGWSNLTNFSSRTYYNLYDVPQFYYQIGSYIVGKELIMHDTFNNKYYKFYFTNWMAGASTSWNNNNDTIPPITYAGFQYTRTRIISANIAEINGLNVGGNLDLKNRLFINGTGVLLSGEAGQVPITVVQTTGNQIISGNKIFISGVTFSGQSVNIIDANLNLLGVGDMTFSGTNINFINSPVYISGTNLRVDGNILANNLVYNTGDQNISGIKNFYNRPTINGTGVLLSGEAASLPQSIVYNTGNQTISGVKTFVNNLAVQETGIFNALDLSNISSFDFSGTNINLISGNVNISGGTAYISGNQVLTGIDLKNYYPDLLNFSNNFYITGTQNNKTILANSSTTISGIIVSGNATGFNTSIIQIGAGQIQITGSGMGIQINSYNNQYKTAGQFATISILHTGNNRYIMYGNTAL